MDYSYFKKRFQDNILVCIEKVDKQKGLVLFDFIDFDEYNAFMKKIDCDINPNQPTMVLLKNYHKRVIQKNTIYSIKPTIIQAWRKQVFTHKGNNNSFLIGYNIDVSKTQEEIFGISVSVKSSSLEYFPVKSNIYNSSHEGEYIAKKLPRLSGKMSITVCNVGQGNWNEINFDGKTKIVFDAGASMHASKKEIKEIVKEIIKDRIVPYNTSKPILILSHWDIDHYHSLLGMNNIELHNYFSAFICRVDTPNLTSQHLLERLRIAVGITNTITVPADPRFQKGGPTFFRNLTDTNKKIVIYNAQYHKNRNISGLMVVVKSTKKSVILPGDAHYEQISRDILPQLNYRHKHNLVVPHHGGNAGKYIYNIPSFATAENAIISYGHPLSSNINALKKNSFCIRKTTIEKKGITIDL